MNSKTKGTHVCLVVFLIGCCISLVYLPDHYETQKVLRTDGDRQVYDCEGGNCTPIYDHKPTDKSAVISAAGYLSMGIGGVLLLILGLDWIIAEEPESKRRT